MPPFSIESYPPALRAYLSMWDPRQPSGSQALTTLALNPSLYFFLTNSTMYLEKKIFLFYLIQIVYEFLEKQTHVSQSVALSRSLQKFLYGE